MSANTKSIGHRFIHLGRYDRLYVVTFTLVRRKFIHDFLKFIRFDSRHNKDVDLFFVIQKLNILNKEKQSTFIAVFEYIKEYQLLLNLFFRIGMCRIISIKQKMVATLFSQMSQMSYRQYSMFDRLKLSPFFGQKLISNPFARAILEKNVLHINNLEEKIYFQDYMYERYISINHKRHKRLYKQRPKEQDQIQKMLFGKSSPNFQVYICHQDKENLKALLRNKRNQNQKMEDCLSTLESDVEKMDSEKEEEEEIIKQFKGLMIGEVHEDSSDSSSSSSDDQNSSSSSQSDLDSDSDNRYKLRFQR